MCLWFLRFCASVFLVLQIWHVMCDNLLVVVDNSVQLLNLCSNTTTELGINVPDTAVAMTYIEELQTAVLITRAHNRSEIYAISLHKPYRMHKVLKPEVVRPRVLEDIVALPDGTVFVSDASTPALLQLRLSATTISTSSATNSSFFPTNSSSSSSSNTPFSPSSSSTAPSPAVAGSGGGGGSVLTLLQQLTGGERPRGLALDLDLTAGSDTGRTPPRPASLVWVDWHYGRQSIRRVPLKWPAPGSAAGSTDGDPDRDNTAPPVATPTGASHQTAEGGDAAGADGSSSVGGAPAAAAAGAGGGAAAAAAGGAAAPAAAAAAPAGGGAAAAAGGGAAAAAAGGGGGGERDSALVSSGLYLPLGVAVDSSGRTLYYSQLSRHPAQLLVMRTSLPAAASAAAQDETELAAAPVTDQKTDEIVAEEASDVEEQHRRHNQQQQQQQETLFVGKWQSGAGPRLGGIIGGLLRLSPGAVYWNDGAGLWRLPLWRHSAPGSVTTGAGTGAHLVRAAVTAFCVLPVQSDSGGDSSCLTGAPPLSHTPLSTLHSSVSHTPLPATAPPPLSTTTTTADRASQPTHQQLQLPLSSSCGQLLCLNGGSCEPEMLLSYGHPDTPASVLVTIRPLTPLAVPEVEDEEYSGSSNWSTSRAQYSATAAVARCVCPDGVSGDRCQFTDQKLPVQNCSLLLPWHLTRDQLSATLVTLSLLLLLLVVLVLLAVAVAVVAPFRHKLVALLHRHSPRHNPRHQHHHSSSNHLLLPVECQSPWHTDQSLSLPPSPTPQQQQQQQHHQQQQRRRRLGQKRCVVTSGRHSLSAGKSWPPKTAARLGQRSSGDIEDCCAMRLCERPCAVHLQSQRGCHSGQPVATSSEWQHQQRLEVPAAGGGGGGDSSSISGLLLCDD